MAYVHCHNCGWDNDDFLESYGGNKGFIKNFLLEDLKNVIKPSYTNKKLTNRRKHALKFVIHDIKHLYRLNFKQEYKTFKEYQMKNPERICPKCGKKGWMWTE